MSEQNIKSVHPFADAFPMMTDQEMDRLVADIHQHGQIEPCIVNKDGVLLDGRNRRAACAHLGIEPRVRYVNPESETAFILSLNVARRHLTESQRAALALKAVPHLKAEAKERQRTLNNRSLEARGPQARAPQARDLAAQAVGVSGRTVARAERVQRDAPELLEEVTLGNLTVRAAEKRLKQNLDVVQWMRNEQIGEPEPIPTVTAPVDPDPLDLAFLEGAAARLAKANVTWAHDAQRVTRAEMAISIIIEHTHRLNKENRRNP